MKCISKNIEYKVIKVEDTREFYLEVGKVLNSSNYKIKEIKEQHCYPEIKFILVINNIKIETKEGDYILINLQDNEDIEYVRKEVFNKKYIELKEQEEK